MSKGMPAGLGMCLVVMIAVAATLGQLAPAQPAPGETLHRVDFTNGLPDKWEKGKLITDGLSAASRGA